MWRPAHLTSAQMEERRLAAAVLLRQGRLGQAAIARQVGVSRASVCRWAATLAREGRGGLRARPRTGSPGRLGAAWTRLGRLLDRGATAAGFDTEQWTLRRIAELIWREFGVRYHPRYLERPLRAYGFTVQPLRCHSTRFARGTFGSFARPAGPRSATSARLPPGRSARGGPSKKKACREGRTILFLDETGHSFRTRPGTTWARRGLTPVLTRLSKRREVSSIVAVTPAGRLYARHFRSSITSELVIQALRHFRRQIGNPLLVIWDRLNAHRARRTAAFLAAHPRDFAVAYLPAYAPDLNPEELCNACVKRAMQNALPLDVADLHRRARREFRRLQHRSELIVGCFKHAGLSVTQFQ